jgi:hypothetical protein
MTKPREFVQITLIRRDHFEDQEERAAYQFYVPVNDDTRDGLQLVINSAAKVDEGKWDDDPTLCQPDIAHLPDAEREMIHDWERRFHFFQYSRIPLGGCVYRTLLFVQN